MPIRNLAKRFFFGLFLVGVFFAFAGVFGSLATWITIKSRIQGEVVEVPKLFGQTEVEARAVTRSLGLALIVDKGRQVYSSDPNLGQGKVLLQIPRSGRKIKASRAIVVTLSSGPAKKLVPPLVGETLSFANTLLEEVEAKAGLISRIPYHGKTKGRVLDQWPKSGGEVDLNRGASLLVADGEPKSWYVMPELVGKDYQGVKTFLDKYGLRHVAKYKTVDQDMGQVILDQKPKAGFPVSRYETITLTVNKDF